MLGCVVKNILEAEHASKLAIDYLELKGDMLFVDPARFTILSEQLKKLHIPILAMTSPLPRYLNCRIVGDDADIYHALKVFRQICTYGSELGVQTIVLGSGRARYIPDGFPRYQALEQLHTFIKAVVDICAQHAITIAIEPLNAMETNLLNSCDETRVFVDMVGLRNVTIVVDYYHIMMEHLSLDAEIHAARGVIGHVHTSGIPRHCKFMDKDAQAEFVSKVKNTGYNKTISIECAFENFFMDSVYAINVFRQLLN